MKKAIKLLQLVIGLVLFFHGASSYAQCSIGSISGPGYSGGTLQVEGISDSTRTLTMTGSDCSASNITFGDNLPDWITAISADDFPFSITMNFAQNPTEYPRGYYLYIYDNSSIIYQISIEQSDGCITKHYLDTDGDGLGDPNDDVILACVDDNDPTGFGNTVTNNDDYCPDDPNNLCEAALLNLNENRNFIFVEAYDINGNLKARSKSYFDELGKGIQSQSLDIKTGKTWATHTMYDAQGRPAFSTLSAPINTDGRLQYNRDFIKKENGTTNYSEADFETDPENPEKVGTTANTLGHYYSPNNVDTNEDNKGNNYQDVTEYPFSRTIYSDLNPGATLKSVGGNKVDHDNDPNTPEIWLQGYTFSMRASNELSQTDAFNDAKYNDIEIIKTVSRDVHGVEVVAFTDTDGRTLAAARSGNANARDMSIAISSQGYVDIHVPDNITGIQGFVVTSNPSGVNLEVYDLITEELITSPTRDLPNGFYRVAITNVEAYDAVNSPVEIFYKENYYDYSLNEYDEAGRLLASYQPLEKLKSEFEYNSLGQLTYSKSPDEGEARFKYRRDGQIRFSQNSKQKLVGEFSYTNYDSYGRPIESGVFAENTTINFTNSDNIVDAIDDPSTSTDEDGLPDDRCSEQQFTTYDAINDADWDYLNDLFLDSNSNAIYGNPTFLASNVAKTSNENTTTYYSYDVYGRVKWMVQKIAGLGINPIDGAKTIDYKYDAITGNVLEVDYQRHTASERFVHKYTYNVVDELELVETSTDGIGFIEQVKYYYYETGAMRRTELAGNLQGIDYVYNLAGQLKAINDPNGNDPGGDDLTTNGFNTDVFSMSLDYYKGDYTRTSTPEPISAVTDGEDQFNGNIKAMTWKNMHPNGSTDTETYYYGYNKNNWLKSAGFGAPVDGTGAAQDSITRSSVITTNQDVVARQSITLLPGFHVQAGTVFTAKIDANAQGADGGDYNVSNITYDANGNILSLNRNKQNENGGSTAMDQLTYEYYDDNPNDPDTFKPNQLKRVEDAAGAVAGADDIDTQTGDNYKYNEIGQLVENINEGVQYFYNASGLVTEVQHNNQPAVKFYYNDKNHRVRKEAFDSSGNLTSTDYYIRDATGNTLAIYKNNTLTELPIYGSGRIGVHYKATNTDRYQLTDHLGNVRAVVERAEPIPKATTDYYPFGMVMPGRQTMDGLLYRYAFQGQEKDPETGKEAFELRLWDARIGRWLTTDPAGQYSSPYLGMGNNPINGIDPDGAFWIPRINKNGSVSYIAEKGDTAETFSSQYSVTLDQAKTLIGTENIIAGETSVSGQSVYAMNPHNYPSLTPVLKLNLTSKMATGSRVLQQMVFANGHSKSVGAKAWRAVDYFYNVYKQLQTEQTYVGTINIDGESFKAAATFSWYLSRSKGIFKGYTAYGVYFKNVNLTIGTQPVGDMFGKFKDISNIATPYGAIFPEGPVLQGYMNFTVERINENTMMKHFEKNIPEFKYKGFINIGNTVKN